MIPTTTLSTRREFIKTSGKAAAGAALASAIAARSYASENNTIKIALVGCGGRGGGAVAQALSTAGPTKLWAMADFFEQRVQSTLNNLKPKFEKQMDVPPDRQFAGLDGYKKAIDSLDKGDVVLLATPPAFRPIHLEYAVAKGVHVFMEKSFAVDAPGIRRVLKAGEEAAKKNLKIAGGLMSRHSSPLAEAVQRIHGRRHRRGHHKLGLSFARAGRIQTALAGHEGTRAPDCQLQLLHVAQRQLHRGLAHPQH